MTRESSCKVYGQLIWSLVWNWFSLSLSLSLSLSSPLLSVFNQSNWRENSIQQNLNKPELKSAAGKMETIDRKQKSLSKFINLNTLWNSRLDFYCKVLGEMAKNGRTEF